MESFLRDGVDLRSISNHTIGGDGHYFEDSDPPDKIKAYLDSPKETEKLKGMKWLLAMMSQGRDISNFFPDVVKNVIAKSVEVKKMVYIYLVHYADFDKRCREIALLSINSFQKDLAGSNQLIRGHALRVMTSIRVPDIIQIQLLAVRKCSTDKSPYVRKCAAVALPKLYAFDSSQIDQLEEILIQLLQDSSTMVLGSSIAAFNEICPNNFKIIHSCYRKLCHLLADLDEWTQVPLLDMMTRYARHHFMDPSPGRVAVARQQAKNRSTSACKSHLTAFTAVKRRVVKKAFYSDEEDESDDEIVMLPTETEMKVAERGSVFIGADADIEGDLDPDHRLLLKSSLPLLKSRNSGVVLAVVSLHYYCGSRSTATNIQLGKALIRILKNKREIQYIVLTSIITIAQDQPTMFLPYLSEFFVKSTDPIFNRLLKLDILAALTTKDNAEQILRELQVYVRHSNTSFVCATVRAVGRIADVAPLFAETCMDGLMYLLTCSPKAEIIGEVVVTLRQILQQNINSKVSTSIINKLLKLILTNDGLKNVPIARASIVWLIGEFHDILRKLAPDILRILATGFPDEETETKTQIINFALKLSLRLPEDDNVQNMMTYVLEMSRYDIDIDLRDRSRFMTAIMGLAPSNNVDENALEMLSQYAEGILLAPKLPPLTLQGPVDLEGLPHFSIGSLSSVVGHYAKGYIPISPWQENQIDSSIRDRLIESSLFETKLKNDSQSNSKSSQNNNNNNNIKNANKDSSDSDSDSDSDSNENETDTSSDDSIISNSSSDNDSDSSSIDSSDDDGDDDHNDNKNINKNKSNKINSKHKSNSSESESEEDLPPRSQNISQQRSVESKPSIRKVGGKIRKNQDNQQNINHSNSDPSKSLIDIISVPQSNESSRGYELLDDKFDLLQVNSSTSTTSPFGLMNNNTIPSNNQNNNNNNIYLNSTTLSTSIGGSYYPNSQNILNTSSNLNSNPVDDNSILAQIMESFPKPTNTQQTPIIPFNQQQLQQQLQQQVQQQPQLQVQGQGQLQMNEEFLSPPKVILRPEIASGLKISLIFRHGVRSMTLLGSNTLFIEITNCSKEYVIRRVRINFPSDLRRTPLEDIPVVAPGETIRLPVEMILRSIVGKSIRIIITSDRGQFNGDLLIEMWELLSPNQISNFDFETIIKRMGGFCHNSTTINLPVTNLNQQKTKEFSNWMTHQIRSKLNVSLIQSGSIFDSNNNNSNNNRENMKDLEWRFAGSLQKDMREDRILIGISCQSDGKTIINIYSDDAVLSATLLDILKKVLNL